MSSGESTQGADRCLSPRIEAVRERSSAGDANAVSDLWAEVERDGGPLIEPDVATPAHSLVTLLWRGDEETKNVFTFGTHTNAVGSFLPLRQLPGTDVWYRTDRYRNDFRSTYMLYPNVHLVDGEDVREQISSNVPWQDWRPDPLNPRVFGKKPGPLMSVVELPEAPAQSWSDERSGVARGEIHPHRYDSEVLGNTRVLWVYTPSGYSEGNEPPDLLIVFDGWSYMYLVPVPTILDNLCADGLVRPTVAVLVESTDQAGRMLELNCNEQFAGMLVDELIPWLRDRYTFTTDPLRTTVAGSSAGGIGAAYLAMAHPDIVGNVLSQSGAFFYDPGAATPYRLDDTSIDWNWLINQYAARPKLPISFYLEAGEFETAARPGRDMDILEANRTMRDALLEKGYPVHYSEYCGGHEYMCWRGSFADGLIALAERNEERSG